jgi:hypothetical protein
MDNSRTVITMGLTIIRYYPMSTLGGEIQHPSTLLGCGVVAVPAKMNRVKDWWIAELSIDTERHLSCFTRVTRRLSSRAAHSIP